MDNDIHEVPGNETQLLLEELKHWKKERPVNVPHLPFKVLQQNDLTGLLILLENNTTPLSLQMALQPCRLGTRLASFPSTRLSRKMKFNCNHKRTNLVFPSGKALLLLKGHSIDVFLTLLGTTCHLRMRGRTGFAFCGRKVYHGIFGALSHFQDVLCPKIEANEREAKRHQVCCRSCRHCTTV